MLFGCLFWSSYREVDFLLILIIFIFISVRTRNGSQCLNITETAVVEVNNQKVETSTSTTQDIYFLPDLTMEVETSSDKLSLSLNNDLTYLFYSLQRDLATSLPALTMISYPQKLTMGLPPQYDPTKDVSAIFGFDVLKNATYIELKGLSLINNGLFYAAAIESNDSLSINFYDLKKANVNNGFYFMDYLITGQNFSHNFTGVKNNTVYQILYAASEENPGDFVEYIPINSISVNTSFVSSDLSRLQYFRNWILLGFLILFSLI